MTTIEMAHKPRQTWEWSVGLGALFAVFGFIAIVAPVSTSVGIVWLIGALFLATGIAQLIHGFRLRKESGRIGRFLFAGLTIVVGCMVMRNPVIGAVGITAMITVYLLLSGVNKSLMALELRPNHGWVYLFISALTSIALGVVLFITFPISSLLVPGIFFGVDLLIYGISTIGLALDSRRFEKTGSKYDDAPRIKDIDQERAA